MNRNTIQIAIPCGENSECYTAFLIHTALKTASSDANLEFLLGITHSKVNRKYLENLSQFAPITLSDINRGLPYGSYAHGVALDDLFSQFTSKYGMFVDCDVAFLKKNWDQILLKQLVDNVAIIGSEYQKVFAKYLNFPTLFAALFDTSIFRKCNISFLPESVDTHNPQSEIASITIDESNAEIYGRNLGDCIHLDTGCQVPHKLKQNGYSGIPLPAQVLQPKQEMFPSPQLKGEWFLHNEEPFFTHLGRSSSRDFGIDKHAVAWERFVREWLGKHSHIDIPQIPSRRRFHRLLRLLRL